MDRFFTAPLSVGDADAPSVPPSAKDRHLSTSSNFSERSHRSAGGLRRWIQSNPLVRDVTLAIAVFIVAVMPRILGLNVFLTPDELRWTCRSTNFYTALSTGVLEETLQVGHPGVITMWLGSLGQPVDPDAAWARACHDRRTSALVYLLPDEAMEVLRERLFGGRRPVAIFVALGIAGMYWLTARLFNRRIALLGGLLIALDPLYLALSRVLHLDAVTATLMTLSLLSLLVYLLRRPATRYLLLAGLMAGLAALNKSPAMFLLPFTALLVGTVGLRRRRGLRWIIHVLLLWGFAAGGIFVVLWPAMWVDPIHTLSTVLGEAIGYAENPHEGLNYFWGEVRLDPGPFFYPVAWLFRATPPVLLGCLLAMRRLRRSRRAKGPMILLALGGYALMFGLFMTLGAKKFDRYLVPIFPAVDIIAAAGLVALAGQTTDFLKKRLHSGQSSNILQAALPLPRLTLLAIGILVLFLQAVLVLRHHPYYFTYYNPILGDGQTAPDVVLVGWGEGMDQAAHYLNQKAEAHHMQVATRYRSVFGPLFQGSTLEMDDYDPATVDYFLFYQNQVQRNLDPELIDRYFQGGPAELKVSLNGIDYAWLYANSNHVAPKTYIEAHLRPAEDVIVVRGDSQFTSHYRDELPLIEIDLEGGIEAGLAALDKAFQEHKRVWYVRYDDVHPRLVLAEMDYQLATRSFRLAEQEFPDVRVTLYAAPKPPGFTTEPARIPVEVDYGEQLRLVAQGFMAEPLKWGRELGVTLTWKAGDDVARNYTAFLHLIGPDGRRWTQVDKPITDHNLEPISDWAPGTEVRERYRLSIPAGTPPGEYQLRIGVYDSQTGERLPATVAGRPLPGNVYVLNVEVAPPPFTPGLDDLELSQRLEQPVTDWTELIGYSVVTPPQGGEVASLMLLWRVLERPPRDYQLVLELRDGRGVLVADGIFDPAGPAYPTSQWTPDEIVRGWYDLPVGGRALAGEGELAVNFVDEVGQPLRSAALPVGPLEIAGPQRQFEPPDQMDHALGVNLDDRVSLLGFNLARRTVKPGDELHLTLYWQAQELMDVSYTVFVHLLDETGQLKAQVDTVPVDGERPTTTWLSGEVIADPYALTVPADAPAGEYILTTGLYELATLERLPAFSSDGQRLPDDRVILGRVEVQP